LLKAAAHSAMVRLAGPRCAPHPFFGNQSTSCCDGPRPVAPRSCCAPRVIGRLMSKGPSGIARHDAGPASFCRPFCRVTNRDNSRKMLQSPSTKRLTAMPLCRQKSLRDIQAGRDRKLPSKRYRPSERSSPRGWPPVDDVLRCTIPAEPKARLHRCIDCLQRQKTPDPVNRR
jgi:hypothetical protein